MADYISKQRAKDLMGCCLASAKAEYKSAKDEFTKARFEDYISTIQAMIDVVGSVEAADVQPVKQWVKLHDKRPDKEGFYLVCDQYGEYEVVEYIPDIKSWFTHRIKGEIRYWMPLSEPPKDGDTE